jgi:hypothetical protein
VGRGAVGTPLAVSFDGPRDIAAGRGGGGCAAHQRCARRAGGRSSTATMSYFRFTGAKGAVIEIGFLIADNLLMPDGEKENFIRGALVGKLFQDLAQPGKNNFLFEPVFP